MGLVGLKIAYIDAAVQKQHFAVSFHLAVLELPFVFAPVASLPIEYTLPFELIILPVSIVLNTPI